MSVQHGQVFALKETDADGKSLWAYRFRVAGRGSKRVQRGGFASEREAADALKRALEELRRENGTARALTLADLVDQYLVQHDAAPVTVEKLRCFLAKRLGSSVVGQSVSCARRRSQPGG